MDKTTKVLTNIILYIVLAATLLFQLISSWENRIGLICLFFILTASISYRRFYLYKSNKLIKKCILTLALDAVVILGLLYFDNLGNFSIYYLVLVIDVLSSEAFGARFRNVFALLIYLLNFMLLAAKLYISFYNAKLMHYFVGEASMQLLMITIYYIFIYGVSYIIRYVEGQNKKLTEAKLELEAKGSQLEKAYEELKETQEHLIIAEKMAVIGQLVAGVAHEINTPLASIKSNADSLNMLLDRLKDTDEEVAAFKKRVANISSVNSIALKRIIDIVKNLKNFARLDESEQQLADIHGGIDSTLLILGSQLKDRIEIIKNYGELPAIACYPQLLNQVFLNLLVNSIQAIQEKDISGKIKITTKVENNKAFIIIEDNGTGIKEENKSRVFEPGFTTKGVGVGTGLGLSIVYKIIQRHNGNITFKTEYGEGTCFIIELPLSRAMESTE
ncbi:MAG: sensor histidine kinase [Bacillota bacterium]